MHTAYLSTYACDRRAGQYGNVDEEGGNNAAAYAALLTAASRVVAGGVLLCFRMHPESGLHCIASLVVTHMIYGMYLCAFNIQGRCCFRTHALNFGGHV